jgi:hypothetical protein
MRGKIWYWYTIFICTMSNIERSRCLICGIWWRGNYSSSICMRSGYESEQSNSKSKVKDARGLNTVLSSPLLYLSPILTELILVWSSLLPSAQFARNKINFVMIICKNSCLYLSWCSKMSAVGRIYGCLHLRNCLASCKKSQLY